MIFKLTILFCFLYHLFCHFFAGGFNLDNSSVKFFYEGIMISQESADKCVLQPCSISGFINADKMNTVFYPLKGPIGKKS